MLYRGYEQAVILVRIMDLNVNYANPIYGVATIFHQVR